jgi:hypothetical protein
VGQQQAPTNERQLASAARFVDHADRMVKALRRPWKARHGLGLTELRYDIGIELIARALFERPR